MDSKSVALVTGASRGIGYSTALELAKTGVHVVALARTKAGLEQLDDAIHKAGGTCTLLPYDLLKGDLIEGLGPVLFNKFGRLDILIANAGMLGGLLPTAQIDPALWDRVFALNVTANLRLIRTCDPLLRASPSGRAIFVSSGKAHNFTPFWAVYSASKAALEALAMTYAKEVEHTPLRVSIFNPGPVRTSMRAEAFPGEDPNSLPTPDDVAKRLIAECLG